MLSISIVTPSYNQGRFIRRTIESVLSQGVPLEYLVMDGGSQDETVSILKEYGQRITWVSEKDGGQPNGVNKGIHAAHGDIIGWLNSDDIYYPGAVKKALDYLEQHPETGVVYGEAYHIDPQDQKLEKYYTEPWDFKRLLEVCFICQPAVFFRRELIDRYGDLDETLQLAMDYELWIRWGLKGVRFDFLPEVLAGSRIYMENKTFRNREKTHREFNQLLLKSVGYVPERWIYNYGYAAIDSTGRPRAQKVRFSFLASIMTLYASLRWNHRLPFPMVAQLSRWVGGNIKSFLTEIIKNENRV